VVRFAGSRLVRGHQYGATRFSTSRLLYLFDLPSTRCCAVVLAVIIVSIFGYWVAARRLRHNC
jgi:hypothetical protein